MQAQYYHLLEGKYHLMIKRIMSFLFAATLVACMFAQMPMTAYAANSSAVKVGVFEMTSYFTKQADGKFTGYGIDFFDKVANQSDKYRLEISTFAAKVPIVISDCCLAALITLPSVSGIVCTCSSPPRVARTF